MTTNRPDVDTVFEKCADNAALFQKAADRARKNYLGVLFYRASLNAPENAIALILSKTYDDDLGDHWTLTGFQTHDDLKAGWDTEGIFGLSDKDVAWFAAIEDPYSFDVEGAQMGNCQDECAYILVDALKTWYDTYVDEAFVKEDCAP